MIDSAKDQVLGCMVGGAVGDALGYAVEFSSYSSIVGRYGEKGITRYALDGDGLARISDDTQMSLFTAAGGALGDDPQLHAGHYGAHRYILPLHLSGLAAHAGVDFPA